MKRKGFFQIVSLFSLFILVGSFAIAKEAAEAGYWEFSHIVKVDKELDNPGTDKLFSRKGYVTQDTFNDNGPGSLVVNYEMKRLKDGKQHIFRGKLSCKGLPTILKPGKEYSTKLKTEQVEFIPMGSWSHDDASIAFSHSKARESIPNLVKIPFFRLGDLNLPGVHKPGPRQAEEEFTFKAAAHFAGKDEYGVRLFMSTNKIHANRIFVYRWQTGEATNDFHCPHCQKVIDKSLLPK